MGMRWDQHLSRWCRVILAVWVRRLNASQDKNFVSGEKALSASLKSGWCFEGMLQSSLIGRRWNRERNSGSYKRSTHYVDSLYSCYMVYMCLLQGTPPLYSDNGMVSVATLLSLVSCCFNSGPWQTLPSIVSRLSHMHVSHNGVLINMHCARLVTCWVPAYIIHTM